MSWKTSRCSHVLENKDIPHHLLLRNMTDMHRDQWKETKISRVQSFPYKKKKSKKKNKQKAGERLCRELSDLRTCNLDLIA